MDCADVTGVIRTRKTAIRQKERIKNNVECHVISAVRACHCDSPGQEKNIVVCSVESEDVLTLIPNVPCPYWESDNKEKNC